MVQRRIIPKTVADTYVRHPLAQRCGLGGVGEQSAKGGGDVTAGENRFRGNPLRLPRGRWWCVQWTPRFTPLPHLHPRRAPPLRRDPPHRPPHLHLAAVVADQADQSFGERAGAALCALDATAVVQRLPPRERCAPQLEGRRSGLRCDPLDRGADSRVLKRRMQQRAVRAEDGLELRKAATPKPTPTRHRPPDAERLRRLEKGLEHGLADRAPLVAEAAVHVGIAGGDAGDGIAGARDRPPELDRAPILERVPAPGIAIDVLEPIATELQLLQYGGEMDQDVGARAGVDTVAEEEIVAGLHRTAGSGTALEHSHPLPCLRQVGCGDQGVVAASDHGDIEHPASPLFA